MKKSYKWIVHPFSFKAEGEREISVIYTGNEHGLKSYGWFDRAKIFIANDSVYGNIHNRAVPGLLMLAEQIADENNANGIVPLGYYAEDIKAYKAEREKSEEMFMKTIDIKPPAFRDGI